MLSAKQQLDLLKINGYVSAQGSSFLETILTGHPSVLDAVDHAGLWQAGGLRTREAFLELMYRISQKIPVVNQIAYSLVEALGENE